MAGVRTGDTVALELRFHPSLVDRFAASQLLAGACEALRALVDDPDLAVAALPVIDEEPMHRLNAPGTLDAWDWDGPLDVAAVFAQRRAAHPQACALKFSLPGVAESQWSYARLDRAGDAWAAVYAANGVQPGDVVGLAVPRGPAAVAMMLGALKHGAAYMPMDPGFPGERLRFMLGNARAAMVVLAEQSPAYEMLAGELPVVVAAHARADGLTDDGPAAAGVDAKPALAQRREAGTLPAYVMYTSGSTGHPKGIVVPHRAIVRLVCHARFMRLDASTTMLQAAPLGFDAATLEIWGPLLNGGCCAIYTERLPTGHDLATTIARHGVDSAWLTAALFDTVIDDDPQHLRGLAQILTGGEALSVPHVRRARAALPQARFINGYGPTEATTFTCTHTIAALDDDAVDVPIGGPVSATSLRVVNPRLEPVPCGVIGELLVGGLGLAVGYLNNPGETRLRFVERDGERFYRTGDRVRLLASGALSFAGRTDDQVKVRGYRVEPREIQAQIGALAGVRQCAVLTVHDPVLGPRFVAYVALKPEAPALPALREQLAARLPDYMLPAAWQVLDALPVTANGKLDRRALPAVTLASAKPPAQPAEPAGIERTDLVDTAAALSNEERVRLICAVFADVLQLPSFAPGEHFFELGGNSLLAIQAITMLRTRHGLTCPVGDFYSHPVPRELARALARPAASATAGINAGAAMGQGDATRDGNPDADDTDRSDALGQTAAWSEGGARLADAIAVIGMAARFPGAADVQAFWDNLVAGRDGIRRFARAELDASIPPALRDDPAYVPARGVLDDVEAFDAAFFGISPREAELTDPQQRMFLELCWSCMESAGYVPDAQPRPVGVFAGMYNASYFANHISAHPEKVAALGEFLVMLANEKDYIATRTAHRLNLTGPAISVHTACSTSLVAVAQAVESLRAGQCAMALAGGVSITCPTASGHLYQEGAMLSPDGLTRTFDAAAAGTVFSDGAGVVLLKRLADAQRDGDTIHAVIRGAAVNNDGGGKASFMAPSAAGQARVVRAALARAGVPASSIGYLEAHGTATPSGDPIEIDGLKQVFGPTDGARCAIGSVKSNIGHTVTAAGVAGLIKAVLALEHELIPRTLHFERLNPAIDLSGSPFHVAAQNEAWPRTPGRPRRAGVSAFGVGGTNAHVILEEAPLVARAM